MIKTVNIKSSWKGGMRVDGQAGDHRIITDQPKQMGGTEAGPNPLEYFMFSLGGCLATVAAIVARQERIELRDFSIEIEGDYDLDYLMGKTAQGSGAFTDIRVKVYIDADLTEEEKAAFFDKVDSRCPVSNSIREQIQITHDVQ